MGLTVSELLIKTTSAELCFWEIIANNEFLGDEREDYRAGVVASTIANYAGKTLKEYVTCSPLDFMPFKSEIQSDPLEVSQQIDLAMSAIIGRQQANNGIS